MEILKLFKTKEKKPDPESVLSTVYEKTNGPGIIRTENGIIESFTTIGERTEQEDRVVASDNGYVAVIDGMGGHGEGGKAAQIIAETMSEEFKKSTSIDDIIKEADKALKAIRKKNKILEKSGACYVVYKIETDPKTQKRTLRFKQGGDVRLFVVNSRNEVIFTTKDHEDSNTKPENPPVRSGLSTEYYDEHFSISAPGSDSVELPDEECFIITASDGLTGAFNNQEIIELLKLDETDYDIPTIIEKTRKKMKDEKAKKDNISLVVYNLHSVEHNTNAKKIKRESVLDALVQGLKREREIQQEIDKLREKIMRTQEALNNIK